MLELVFKYAFICIPNMGRHIRIYSNNLSSFPLIFMEYKHNDPFI